MSYKKSIELAGCTVIAYEEFGSYQGDWIAIVEYNSVRGVIKGYFGSCSGCDAFQSEFGYQSHEHKNGDYVSIYDIDELLEGCPECDILRQGLIDFGKGYIDEIMTFEEAIEKVSENLEWDLGAEAMLDFINKYKD